MLINKKNYNKAAVRFLTTHLKWLQQKKPFPCNFKVFFKLKVEKFRTNKFSGFCFSWVNSRNSSEKQFKRINKDKYSFAEKEELGKLRVKYKEE